MESYKIENLSFTYPNREVPAVFDVSLRISKGEFVTVCGKSGCGKTTLLRLLKPSLSPFGKLSGSVLFEGQPVCGLDSGTEASEIGFVLQNPDNQIVTDKVWHELAFGLESLGFSNQEIRTRVAEMASFFGIEGWFHKKVTELSGGQKQLLNLASVMVMQPSVLILDEPTSQLDPIAAQEFIGTLRKINRELGTTVILTEHRLEEAFPASDRVVVMDEGRIIADDSPCRVGQIIKSHDIAYALPTPVRIFNAVENCSECPVTVRDGRKWLEAFSERNSLHPEAFSADSEYIEADAAIEVKDAWFRYERELPDVVKGLSLKVNKGEIFSVLGGNGTGKTTALSLVSGLNTPQRGTVIINGRKLSEISGLYEHVLGVLPQNPQSLFVKKTVRLDLLDMLSETGLSESEKEREVKRISRICRIERLLQSHPYDISGGEQQRAALAKILLKKPGILLLDEPTKGMDAHFKQIFACVLTELKSKGVTVLMVSHDIEFCAEFSDRCAMFFDGSITSVDTPRKFFAGKSFYTTAANRMAREQLPGAVLPEDVILACGGKLPERKHTDYFEFDFPEDASESPAAPKLSRTRVVSGAVFALLYIITAVAGKNFSGISGYIFLLIGFLELAACLTCFFPKRELGIECEVPKHSRKLSKRTIVAVFLILITIPITVLSGVFLLDNRKYYFISLLVILQTMIPFSMIFESRKPQARELIIISVLCAIAVAGRSAFFMLPQFKPVSALVIITGVCFGGEAGFLVGAMTALVSNFFFGQGPWTPWQMFAFGSMGFLAGIFFRKGFLRKTRLSLSVFGALVTFFVYGGIINPASVIMWQPNPTAEMIFTAYLTGIPFDAVHAASTAVFMWFLSEPLIDKLERVKVKYGLISG